MKKLALQIDDLTVDSFETTRAHGDDSGTVHGHLDEAADPQPGDQAALPYTYGNTCPGYPTCGNSCQSCMQTCGYTYYPCCQYA
jgi:hypothetical protein